MERMLPFQSLSSVSDYLPDCSCSKWLNWSRAPSRLGWFPTEFAFPSASWRARMLGSASEGTNSRCLHNLAIYTSRQFLHLNGAYPVIAVKIFCRKFLCTRNARSSRQYGQLRPGRCAVRTHSGAGSFRVPGMDVILSFVADEH